MIDESPRSEDDARETSLPRVFIREPGWRIGQKVGSEKTFCYQMAPGEDYYHRLLDGEVLVSRGEEKLCLPCAERRGLITFIPRTLRETAAGVDMEVPGAVEGYDVKG